MRHHGIDATPRQAALAALAASLLAAAAAPAGAQAPVPPTEPGPFSTETVYVLGGNLAVSPNYTGAAGHRVRWRPLWAVRHGRYRLSGAGAGGLLASPGDLGTGASAQLLDHPDWKLGAALRIDNGRRASDDPALAGQPDVRRTLRGRLYGSINLGERWSVAVALSPDLLGRGGGATATLDAGYAWAPWHGVSGSIGLGLTLADTTHLRSYYGVGPEAARATGHPVFSPRAGVQDRHAGFGLQMPLGPHWRLIGGMGYAQLQGGAADSPLTRRRSSVSANLGLAWRSD